MYNCNSVSPENIIRKTYGYGVVDLCKIFGIRYIGPEESGLVTIAATTNDLTFEHGDLSSEAVDGTVGSAGVLNISAAEYSTVQEVLRATNVSANWEAWPIDFLPDAEMEVTAGNGIILAAGIAAQQCKTDAGVLIPTDTSLAATPEKFPVGVTFEGPSSGPHNKDANVVHEILAITVDCNATTAGGVYIYEVDDLLGTKTELDILVYVDDTAITFSNSGEPLYQVIGNRLVVEVRDAGAMTDCLCRVSARSYPFGPAVRKSKLLSSF